jgi:hypothetical protein
VVDVDPEFDPDYILVSLTPTGSPVIGSEGVR